MLVELTIKPLQIEHLPQVELLGSYLQKEHFMARKDLFKETSYFTYDFFTQILNDDTYFLLGAFTNNEVVGFMLVKFIYFENHRVFADGKLAIIEDIVVEPIFQKQGIASALINELKDICYLNDISRIELNVFSFNTNAINLYKKLGFTFKNHAMEYKIKSQDNQY